MKIQIKYVTIKLSQNICQTNIIYDDNLMTSSLNVQNLEFFVFLVCYDQKILYVRLICNKFDILTKTATFPCLNE